MPVSRAGLIARPHVDCAVGGGVIGDIDRVLLRPAISRGGDFFIQGAYHPVVPGVDSSGMCINRDQPFPPGRTSRGFISQSPVVDLIHEGLRRMPSRELSPRI